MSSISTPEFWEWATAWTRDPIVWDWIRTGLAALTGALIGGLFTLSGQRQARLAQEASQRREFEAAASAASIAAERERAARAWERSLETATDLFEQFTSLHRAIRDAPKSKAHMVGGTVWDQWDLIWDGDKALQFDVGSRLIADDPTRLTLQRIVWLLDRSEQLTAGYNPEAVTIPHPALALQLTIEAIEVVGSYIRLSPLSDSHKELIEALEKAWGDYVQHEEEMFDLRRSESAALQTAAWERLLAASRHEQSSDSASENPVG